MLASSIEAGSERRGAPWKSTEYPQNFPLRPGSCVAASLMKSGEMDAGGTERIGPHLQHGRGAPGEKWSSQARQERFGSDSLMDRGRERRGLVQARLCALEPEQQLFGMKGLGLVTGRSPRVSVKRSRRLKASPPFL